MRQQQMLIALCAALLLAGTAGLFFACFERRQVERVVGGSEEARRNSFLAAERLLAALGHQVHSLPGPYALDSLPPVDATLLFTPNRRTVSDGRHAELRRWVEAGGHLIVEAWELWYDEDRRDDALLDPVGFEAYEVVPEQEEEPASDAAAEASESDPTEYDVQDALDLVLGDWRVEDPSSLVLPGLSRPLNIEFNARYVWHYAGEAPRRFAAVGESGEHLISVALGRGTLTAVTDGAFLMNDSLAGADHAEALVRLVRLHGAEREVWIVTGETWPGVWGPLWRHGRPALAGAGLLLAAFLWRAARRRGPIRPEPARERRRWLEHLDAVGRYHWQRDRGRDLLDAARRGLLRDLDREHPGLEQLPRAELHARLAQRSGLASGEVARALTAQPSESKSSFVDTVRNLERIRNP